MEQDKTEDLVLNAIIREGENEKTSPQRLQEIYNTYHHPKIKSTLINNPNTPLEILLELGEYYPAQLLKNPVFDLYLLSDPNFLAQIPENTLTSLLKLPQLPKDFVLYILNHHKEIRNNIFHLIIANHGQLWSNWRKNNNDIICINSTGVIFKECSFRGGDFRGLKFRSDDEYSRADLRGIDFTGANLSNADLQEAELNHANLQGANLTNADLIYADLRDANLTGVNFTNTKLGGALLSNLDLSGVDLSSASFIDPFYSDFGVDFSNSDLSDTNLSHADFTNANFSYADFTNADLSHADLTNADLSYADLMNANLSYADLTNADLSYADFTGTDLSYADLDFSDTNLTYRILASININWGDASLKAVNFPHYIVDEYHGFLEEFYRSKENYFTESDLWRNIDYTCDIDEDIFINESLFSIWYCLNFKAQKKDLGYLDLRGFDFKGYDLSYGNLQKANLSETDLSKTNFSYGDLSDANLSHCDLSDADLSYCNLSYADLSNTILINANLIGADLTGANLTDIIINETKKIDTK